MLLYILNIYDDIFKIYIIYIYIFKCGYLNFPVEPTAIDSASRLVSGTKYIFIETKN